MSAAILRRLRARLLRQLRALRAAWRRAAAPLDTRSLKRTLILSYFGTYALVVVVQANRGAVTAATRALPPSLRPEPLAPIGDAFGLPTSVAMGVLSLATAVGATAALAAVDLHRGHRPALRRRLVAAAGRAEALARSAAHRAAAAVRQRDSQLPTSDRLRAGGRSLAARGRAARRAARSWLDETVAAVESRHRALAAVDGSDVRELSRAARAAARPRPPTADRRRTRRSHTESLEEVFGPPGPAHLRRPRRRDGRVPAPRLRVASVEAGDAPETAWDGPEQVDVVRVREAEGERAEGWPGEWHPAAGP